MLEKSLKEDDETYGGSEVALLLDDKEWNSGRSWCRPKLRRLIRAPAAYREALSSKRICREHTSPQDASLAVDHGTIPIRRPTS